MNTRLLELSDKLKSLKDRKSKIEAELKSVNEQIEVVTMDMVEMMVSEELTSFNRNGVSFSIVVQEFPSAVPENKEELYERMKEQGYEHLFSINSRTLQGTIKELIENNDGVLPDWLNGLVHVAEKSTIRISKTKKY